MAITPKDVELTKEELSLADALERQMDKMLSEKFVSDQPTVLNLSNFLVGTTRADHMPMRIINEVMRRYRVVGWNVERENFIYSKKNCITFISTKK